MDTSPNRDLVVLHVAETLPGGIATYINEVLPAQQREFGVDRVHVLAPASQLSQIVNVPQACLHAYERKGRDVLSLLRLAWKLWTLKKTVQPQIVHFHSTFAGAVGRLMRPFSGKAKLIYCPHGWAFLRDDKPWLQAAYVLAERLLEPLGHAWVAISLSERDAAAQGGISTRRARLVINGVRDAAPAVATPKISMDPQRINLIFVGRHDRQKGLDLLLSAMARIQDSRVMLYVIGAAVVGGESEKVTQPNVRYVGWLKPSELQAYYQACDGVIMPSRWEGCPFVPIEAMRESKAMLASNRGPLPEMVIDGLTGRLFDPDDTTQLAGILNTLRREDLTLWGQAGRARYLECYTADRMNAELIALYRDLLRN